jgi:HSP20 family molecular chaperone IbpA
MHLSCESIGEKANANQEDGVLTLQIAKPAQYQPRKIEVGVG